MSDQEFARCDAECERILRNHREELRRKAEAEALMEVFKKDLAVKAEQMKTSARRRQVALNSYWACTFMCGVFAVLATMFTVWQNTLMAVAASIFCLIALFCSHKTEPHAYDYQGKWAKT